MKSCIDCGETKPLDSFYLDKGRGVRRGACKKCEIRRAGEWRMTNRARFRDLKLRANYGIGIQDYLLILRQQQYRCATCRIHQYDHKNGWLAVDHNHATNANRGLLCLKCNTALGKVGEDVSTLARMILYVLDHNGTSF